MGVRQLKNPNWRTLAQPSHFSAVRGAALQSLPFRGDWGAAAQAWVVAYDATDALAHTCRRR
ncbi:MAG: hypothetical protein RIQ75_305, partial [Pseudomonadota bacterium]